MVQLCFTCETQCMGMMVHVVCNRQALCFNYTVKWSIALIQSCTVYNYIGFSFTIESVYLYIHEGF